MLSQIEQLSGKQLVTVKEAVSLFNGFIKNAAKLRAAVQKLKKDNSRQSLGVLIGALNNLKGDNAEKDKIINQVKSRLEHQQSVINLLIKCNSGSTNESNNNVN